MTKAANLKQQDETDKMLKSGGCYSPMGWCIILYSECHYQTILSHIAFINCIVNESWLTSQEGE